MLFSFEIFRHLKCLMLKWPNDLRQFHHKQVKCCIILWHLHEKFVFTEKILVTHDVILSKFVRHAFATHEVTMTTLALSFCFVKSNHG